MAETDFFKWRHYESEITLLFNPGLGFFSFNTARRAISGHEAMSIIRKGQVKGIGKLKISVIEFSDPNFAV